ncbi:hypothetical protein MC885_006443, partial [Smutsia gigantea]
LVVGVGRTPGFELTPGTAPGPHFLAARGFLHQRRALGGGFPFTLMTAARPPASAEQTATCASACAPGLDIRAGGPDGDNIRWCPGSSSIGGCLSDFALAPLRGLDVQTSAERAEREGPGRGRRRREAPPLKGAGRAPPLGRTRGRKEGAGPPGPARGCERPQGAERMSERAADDVGEPRAERRRAEQRPRRPPGSSRLRSPSGSRRRGAYGRRRAARAPPPPRPPPPQWRLSGSAGPCPVQRRCWDSRGICGSRLRNFLGR